ncbi:MAG: hypothetical protein JWO05_3919 [Gemmatimonadetes bacterium]|nr:hypothetical protein [Gemmatimonadota bacterium]
MATIRQPSSGRSPAHLDATEILENFKGFGAYPSPASSIDNWLPKIESEPPESTYSLNRLARVVAEAWRNSSLSPTSRPDVLGIACSFLANPAGYHSFEVARFAVVLALRARYGIEYSPSVVESFRRSYDALRLRHVGSRARILKRASNIDFFLIDLLCMDGRMRRRHSVASLARYYQSFRDAPFGIGDRRPVALASEDDAPVLVGTMPDFGTIINEAFGQPTGIPGIDSVMGGLLSPVMNPDDVGHGPMSRGGLITLISGAPGSGKTSLALSLAKRLAEMGSVVSYLSMEEQSHVLRAKAATMSEPLSETFHDLLPTNGALIEPLIAWPSSPSFKTLGELYETIRSELAQEDSPPGLGAFQIPFPRVVVVDSITALMEHFPQGGQDRASAQRIHLTEVLRGFRELGVCILMIGTPEDADDTGLAYIVDNVLTLSLDSHGSQRHPLRLLSLNKTRLQRSSRGSHVFHLGGVSGCSVSPSLHAVLRELKHFPDIQTDPNRRAVFWVPSEKDVQQAGLPGILTDSTRALTRRDRAQSLLYGSGSAGKARLALSMALEPIRDAATMDDCVAIVAARARGDRYSEKADFEQLRRSRILIVSFLYDEFYYRRALENILRERFGRLPPQSEDSTRSTYRSESEALSEVVFFHPGFVDPETVVGRIRSRLLQGQLDGRPFSSVVLDGVQNVLMQFPLLQSEPLLWPTIYRLLRVQGISSITTFTFFELQSKRLVVTPAAVRSATSDVVRGVAPQAADLFFSLLVGSCDYTYSVARAERASLRQELGELIQVVEETSPESFASLSVLWNPKDFSFSREGR